MKLNEAKQAAYSAANRARAKTDELLKTVSPTLEDVAELQGMAQRLHEAADELVRLLTPAPVAVAKPRKSYPKKA